METKDNLSNIYEKLYFHEIEVRDGLYGRLQLPFALLMSLLGVYGFLSQNVDLTQSGGWFNFFVLASILGFCLLLFSAFFVIKALHGNTYSFLATPKGIEGYCTNLQGYYEGKDDIEVKISNDITKYLNDSFANSASKNAECNDKRSRYLHRAMQFLIVSGILTMLAFGICNIADLRKPNSVEISNFDILVNAQLFSNQGKNDSKEE